MSWTKVGADIDGEAAWDKSGYSVSLSEYGTRVAIGAPYNDGNVTNSLISMAPGHVRVYTYVPAESVGDPYVSPLYGDAYKLPDRAGNYRYVSTFSPYNRRFTIDADVRMLRKDEQADMLRYILAHNKDRVAELQGRIVLDG